jgi:hypothetical protein
MPVTGQDLQQGDYLPSCAIPVFSLDLSQAKEEGYIHTVNIKECDTIVITQSCDLQNNKARQVAVCPIYTISNFSQYNEEYRRLAKWNEVRKGRIEGLHLLGSPTEPNNNQLALVVDFREIYSLPVGYLSNHAVEIGDRWRLRSPYLEHFSQSFARFFMRVGLPSAIPEFK